MSVKALYPGVATPDVIVQGETPLLLGEVFGGGLGRTDGFYSFVKTPLIGGGGHVVNLTLRFNDYPYAPVAAGGNNNPYTGGATAGNELHSRVGTVNGTTYALLPASIHPPGPFAPGTGLTAGTLLILFSTHAAPTAFTVMISASGELFLYAAATSAVDSVGGAVHVELAAGATAVYGRATFTYHLP